jgi:ATP adenylyltransferase
MRLRMTDSPSDGVTSDFLDELSDPSGDSHFARVYGGDPPSRILALTQHFAVFVDYSALVRGHLLIVPRTFVPSLAALQAHGDELEALVAIVSSSLVATYGHCVIIEHGSALSMLSRSGCVVHAHLHLLPTRVTFRDPLHQRNIGIRDAANFRDALESAPAYQPYLLIGDASGHYVAELDESSDLPRQFARAHIAATLGITAWDWEAFVRHQLLRDTMEDLRPFTSAWSSVSGRTEEGSRGP